jgi:hypothetical protein
MPYKVLPVAGDGDRFFTSVGVHFRDNIPAQWLNDDPFGFQESHSYDEKLIQDAGNIRWNIVNWTATQLFGKTVRELCSAWEQLSFTSSKPADALGAWPDPDFSHELSEDCFALGFEKTLGNRWEGADKPTKKAFAWFFLYWYASPYSEIAADRERLTAIALWLGLPEVNDCIHGDFTEGMRGDDPASGFAAYVVFKNFEITLAWMSDDQISYDEDGVINVERAEDLYYLVGHGSNYNPAVWVEEPNPISLYEGGFDYESDREEQEKEKEKEKEKDEGSSSRHIDNTRRAPLLFGIGVWNVNHLSKSTVAKTKKVKDTQLRVSLRSRSKNQTTKGFYFEGGPNEEDDYRLTKKGWSNKRRAIGAPEREDSKRRLVVEDSEDEDAYDKEGFGKRYDEDIEREKKTLAKVQAMGDIIANNLDWLDVLALNEVNEGVDRLNSVQNVSAISKGPQMISRGAKTNDGQHEYYPLVIVNRKRDFSIIPKGCITVDSQGRMVDNPANVTWMKAGNKVEWKKLNADDGSVDALPEYRPVVVHRLMVDEGSPRPQPVNVAILHTTPEGTEFEREAVFLQLKRFFDGVAKHSFDQIIGRDLWLIAGDFYLFGESLTTRTLTAETVPEEAMQNLETTLEVLEEDFYTTGKDAQAEMKELQVLQKRLETAEKPRLELIRKRVFPKTKGEKSTDDLIKDRIKRQYKQLLAKSKKLSPMPEKLSEDPDKQFALCLELVGCP